MHDKDIVYLQNGNGEGDGDGSNVFDLTSVCPPFCPLPSVLSQ
ncbi:hypothetical protein [Mucilaginibacter sp.]